MINKFIKINSSHGELFIKNFEDCLGELTLISCNDNYIYIPDIVTFSNVNNLKIKKLFNKIVNLGIETIEVDNIQTFNDMLSAITFYSKNKNIIQFKSNSLPQSNVFLNIENLIKRCVFFKISSDLIIINDIFFTTNEAEFHGVGMFVNKKIYLVNEYTFEDIKSNLDLME